MATIFMMSGGLFPTGFLSRILLWLFKRLGDTPARIYIANGISLILSAILAGLGAADGGPFVWSAGLVYVVPQLVWLVIDLLVRKGKRSKAAKDAKLS